MSDLVSLFQKLDYGPAPESDQPAQQWLESHQRSFGFYLNGNWEMPKDAELFSVENPATGEQLATCRQASSREIAQALSGAREAQPKWEKLTGHQRAKYLYALAREMQQHSRVLSVLETLDNGKPFRESRDIDIPLAVRHFYHHAGWAQLVEEEYSQHVATGVVGQIIPWNFPLLMLAWKVAPALACGNTVLLKPAEQTPLTALWFAECCHRIGLPAGVFQLLTGDGRTGEELVCSKGLDKIAFTGSTSVGKRIRELTADSDCKLTLELGGKSPFIVFEDADLDAAVEGVVDAIWLNQGEVCCAGSRLLLQESIAEKMVGKLQQRMQQLRVGNPLEKAIDIGSLVSKTQLERVKRLTTEGAKAGATLWQPQISLPETGCFFAPTLAIDVDPSSVLAQDEIFGPVAATMTFRTPSEALELANNTMYGLAASVWSENINQALHLAPSLQAGVVWVNCTNQFDAACGFGGYQESGYGREGGREGLLEYMKPKMTAFTGKKLKRPDVQSQSHTTTLEGSEIHRTAKFFIAGKQARPDGGTVRPVWNKDGSLAGTVGQGNRKDLRNAVEAAQKASTWSKSSSHLRAQILFYFAENLSLRRQELETRLQQLLGCKSNEARQEVDSSIQRCFHYAAWADKYEGTLHQPPQGLLVPVLNEPLGVIGLICPDENPLLSFLSILLPSLAAGNRSIVIPSPSYPLIANDLIQVTETSDIPAGAVNLISGNPTELIETLAAHEDLNGIWVFGTEEEVHQAKRLSTSNLKRVWSNEGQVVDWYSSAAQGREWLRQASQSKNIWIPFGE